VLTTTLKEATPMGRITYVLAAAFLPLTALAQGPATPNTGDAEAHRQAEQMAQMQRNMDAMHEQMARIHATQDPQERQRLMHDHMQNLHQGMMMMGQMMGPMGQGGAPRACAEGDTECRMNQMQMQQQMIGQRMGMMQQMMQQMMEQMAAGQATEPVGSAEAPGSPTAPAAPDAEAEDHEQHH
jgi:hypothetical protein